MKGINKILHQTLIVDRFSQNISPHSISAKIIIKFFITKLIGDVVFFFFIIIVFTMVRRRVDVMEWTILWVMLRQRSFTIFAMIVRTERFEMTGSLALETYTASHVRGKDFVDK
jgi:hypothetical protein